MRDGRPRERETYLDDIAGNPDIEIISDPYDLEFDANGFLVTNW